MAWTIGKMFSGGGRHGLNFCDVISLDNLFLAWREFSRGKKKKQDIAGFELNLEDNIFRLHELLRDGDWVPDPYVSFRVCDPKPRTIHKASVRDRVLFQAVYRKSYQIFDPGFIFDSYSSRLGKGTHAGIERFDRFACKMTGNHRRRGFVLKCDVKRFFDTIDHGVLILLIARKIKDERMISLLRQIIFSFEKTPGKGLPLGNVTSQLFANIYLNELDQFVKHKLKVKFYIRYCDDFVILHESFDVLLARLTEIGKFLDENLRLSLHGRKVLIGKIHSGTDFLGYVSLSHRRVLRTRTKQRMFRRINSANLASYLGILSHCMGNTMKGKIFEKLKKK